MGASLARSLGQSDDFGCGGWQRPGKSCFSQISAPEGRRTVQPPGGTTEGGDRARAPRHAVYAGDDQEGVPHHVRIKMDSCVPQWRPSGLAGANPAVGSGGVPGGYPGSPRQSAASASTASGTGHRRVSRMHGRHRPHKPPPVRALPIIVWAGLSLPIAAAQVVTGLYSGSVRRENRVDGRSTMLTPDHAHEIDLPPPVHA